jgi:glycosyltransferase involved in cell wall biosynthesis
MISIIIPTLNEESVIEKTLTSLKKTLTTIPYEIIISDGKSKDRTVEIARSHGAKVVVHDKDYRQTIAEGRNAGAAAMSPESTFAVFMDADCTIFNGDSFFDLIFAHFKRDPKLVAVNVAIRVLPQFETFADKVIFTMFNDYLWLANNIFHFAVSAGEFQMIRQSSFEQVNGYNPKLVAAEDVDLFRRLAKIGNVRFEKELTIFHTGRRAHKIGWPKLLYLWVANPLWMMIRGKAVSTEWKPIR